MRSYHSRAYRRHFEGYTEFRNPKTGKIERTYTAKYYCSTLSNQGLRRRKITYVSVFVLAVVLWCIVSLSGLPGTMTDFVSVFTSLALFPLFFTVVSLVSFCIAPRNMTISEYNSACVRFKWSALGSAVVLLLAAVAELFYVFLNSQDFLFYEFFGVAGHLAASALLFILFSREHNSNYQMVANPNSSLANQDGATEITI